MGRRKGKEEKHKQKKGFLFPLKYFRLVFSPAWLQLPSIRNNGVSLSV